ncbi:SMP-30/gluconolactonase/LRE family protein [bacterium]|nr:SMP-30/gluconolactonase/LRE family protein [bacterium]
MSDASSLETAPVRSNRSRQIAVLLATLGLGIAIFLAWPSSIDPVSWEVPPAQAFEGPLAVNQDLASAKRIIEGTFVGPEDVDVDSQGRVYAGLADGRIIRLERDGTVTDWCHTQGRPLGMDFDADGNLVVCDAVRGLCRIDPAGKLTTLVPADGPVKLGFTDDCEIAGDGVIYFSDASDKYGVGYYMEDLMEARPHGKLLAYDPKTGKTTVLLDMLYFANGVAVADDDSFVLVNETYRFRVIRYWLKGDKKGESEVFIEHLPGYPDGISSSPRGTFWIALFTVRNPTADALATKPWIRAQMVKLPPALLPKPVDYGLIIEVDSNGRTIRSMHDPSGKTIANVTSVHEEKGKLYLGNLLKNYVGALDLPLTP